jgi:hypothetical protein
MPRYELVLEAPTRVRIVVAASSFKAVEQLWLERREQLAQEAFDKTIEIDIAAARLVVIFRATDVGPS